MDPESLWKLWSTSASVHRVLFSVLVFTNIKQMQHRIVNHVFEILSWFSREILSPFSLKSPRGIRRGKCHEISGEILLFLFPQETKLESAQKFLWQIPRHFSPNALQLQMPNLMVLFTLQTFVLDTCRWLIAWIPLLPWFSRNFRDSGKFGKIREISGTFGKIQGDSVELSGVLYGA